MVQHKWINFVDVHNSELQQHFYRPPFREMVSFVVQ